MIMRIINKVLTILMQLMWKVVQPEDLQTGDHIYRYGLLGLFSHHGIYIGDDRVIHFNPRVNERAICPSLSKISYKQESSSPCPVCKYSESIHGDVVKTCLDCFRRDHKKLRSLHRYEYGWPLLGFMLARRGTCTMLRDPERPDQAVARARDLHEKNDFGDYSLINNNCEHFATFCRTGNRVSEQAAFFQWVIRKLRKPKNGPRTRCGGTEFE